MKKLSLAILVSIAAWACETENSVLSEKKEKAQAQDCVEKPKNDVLCTADYNPVCGCNGKTYGNACTAAAMGIRVVSTGECPK
ncbi:MAG: Kazal-type serine protease inhibitor family protein [Spirosomataceae bacterium]